MRTHFPNRPELQELEDRIANWRRYFQEKQKIMRVSWYTPPSSGNIINDEIAITSMTPEIKAAIEKSISQRKDEIGRMPIQMQDAVLLEHTWCRLPDPAKKLYIKLEKIDQLSRTEKGCFILWRKMRAFGVKISSYEAHNAYDRAALSYFQRQLMIQ